MLMTTAAAAALSSNKRGSSGSAYIDSGVLDDSGNTNVSLYRAPKRNRFRKILDSPAFRVSKITASGLGALFLFIMSVFTVGGAFFGYDVIESMANDDIEEWTEDYEESAQSTIDNLTSDIDEASPSQLTPTSEPSNSLGYVFHRLFIPGYMNNVEYAVAPWGDGDGFRVNENWMCENPSSNPIQGTPMYHNCDVPNVMAQLGQWGFGSISKYGVENAELRDPRTGFGVPDDSLLPRGEVPASMESAADKYTGLEKYGYNLRYTTYVGEWDDIGVMVEARALQNFSGFDRLRLGASAVWNGISGGLQGAADGLGESWSNAIDAGGVRYVTAPVEALWGAFTGAVSGFSSSTIRTFLDTSDYNVFNTGSWYRRQYPETLYGNVRQLTDEEISQIADRRQRFAMLEGYWNALAEFDVEGMDEIEALDPGASNSPLGDLPEFPTEEEIQMYEESVEEWEEQRAAWSDYNDERRAFDPDEDHPSDEPVPPDFPNPGPTPPEQPYEYETIDEWIDDYSGFFGNAGSTDRGNFSACLTNDVHGGEAVGLRDCWVETYAGAMGSLVSDNLDLLARSIQTSFFSSFLGFFSGDEAPSTENMTLPANHPFNRYVCEDSSGNIYLNTNMTEVRTLYVSPNSSETRSGCPSSVREPVQDGLFGNGYSDSWSSATGGSEPAPDTRREAFNPYKALGVDFIFDFMNGASGFFMWVTTRITAFSNFLIDLSFNPPLQWLGFDEIASGLIESFRDSMFFPLTVIVVVVGAVIIMYTHVRKREYRQAWFSIVMMFLVSISGVVIMEDPDRLIELSDDIPSTVENAFAAGIFSTMSADNDAICSPTGTPAIPEGQEYGNVEDFDGNTMGTSLVVRAMMCETWRNFAFTPWTYGQFGTGYQSLNTSQMNNTNGSLVGSARVNMGGGATANNWALYHLDTTTTGTITNQGDAENVGYINPNIYRLVDLQAGPNNAAGADTRYFDRWSGNDTFGRALDSAIAVLTAAVGMAAILTYVVIKLEYTLFVTMLLIILPIMFLIGLEPARGRATLRKYFGSLVGAMMKRVMAVFFLAMMLSLMTHASATATGSYWHVAVLLILISLIFIMNRKRFMEFVEGAGNAVGNGTLGQDGHKMPLGKFFSGQFGKTVAKGFQGAVAGAAVGSVAGTFSGAVDSWKDSRQAGKSLGGSVFNATRSGLKHGLSEAGEGFVRSGSATTKRFVAGIRSAEGMGVLNRMWDLNENLNRAHTRQMSGGRYDDASRRFGVKQATEAIGAKQQDLAKIDEHIESLKANGVGDDDEAMIQALEAKVGIKRELAELKDMQDRALYSKDWKADEAGDIGSAAYQRDLRREHKRLSKDIKTANKGKGATLGAERYNEGVSSSYVLTDPMDPSKNYLQETAEQDRQRSARHHEIMEQRKRVGAAARQSMEDKHAAILADEEALAWQRLIGETGYRTAEDMKQQDPDLYNRVEDRVGAIVDAKRTGLKHELEAEVAAAMDNEQFKHARYGAEFEHDRVSIKHALGDAYYGRKFGVENDLKNSGTIGLTDDSTGASAEIRLSMDEDGKVDTAEVSITDRDGRTRDLGQMKVSGNMKEPFDAAYKELGKESESIKRADTAGGDVDESTAYNNHLAQSGRRAYLTYEIPQWADKERSILSEQLSEATTDKERQMIRDRMSEVDDIERRAAAQQDEIENRYHGGTAAESGIDASNVGSGVRGRASRAGERFSGMYRESKAHLRFRSLEANRMRRNRVSRNSLRRSTSKLYNTGNRDKQMNKIRRELSRRQAWGNRADTPIYVRNEVTGNDEK